MPDIRIFTESKADVKFLKDYISQHFNDSLQKNAFYELNSWSGYKKNGQVINVIRENADTNNQTILILDADHDFAKRKTEVTNDFKQFQIPFYLFLFPNNIEKGNLEDLLTKVAVDRRLIDCFHTYEECVKDYNLPLEKSRIYSYLDSILPPDCKTIKNDMRREENRDYKNPAYWDLHHPYLQPLRHFLSPFFI